MTTIEPRPLWSLVAQLGDLDVDLPPEVVSAASLLEDAATGELKRLALEPAPLDLLHADRAALVEHIREHAARRLVMDTMADSAWQVSLSIAQQAGDLLAEHADDVIAQLRPAFEQAAAAVSLAAKTGIHAGIKADQVIDLGPKAITAWRTLPEHAATLDRIAAARIAMSDPPTQPVRAARAAVRGRLRRGRTAMGHEHLRRRPVAVPERIADRAAHPAQPRADRASSTGRDHVPRTTRAGQRRRHGDQRDELAPVTSPNVHRGVVAGTPAGTRADTGT